MKIDNKTLDFLISLNESSIEVLQELLQKQKVEYMKGYIEGQIVAYKQNIKTIKAFL
jgi:hypothetical protein